MAHDQSVSSGTPTVDLAPIKAREEAATQGPWIFRVVRRGETPDRSVLIGAVAPGHQIRATPPGGTYPSRDGEFMAHARTDIPQLIAEVERLRTALSALSGQTAPPCPSIPEHCDWPNCVKVGHRYFDHACVDRSALSSASTPENEGSEQQKNETTKS